MLPSNRSARKIRIREASASKPAREHIRRVSARATRTALNASVTCRRVAEIVRRPHQLRRRMFRRALNQPAQRRRSPDQNQSDCLIAKLRCVSRIKTLDECKCAVRLQLTTADVVNAFVLRVAPALPKGLPKGGGENMKFHDEKGKIGYIILWFLGVPASILILIFLLRGCT